MFTAPQLTVNALLHPIVAEAAEGRLPDWAVAGEKRTAHMSRVASLLDMWADERGLDDGARTTWRALGYLHDALRDEAPEILRERVSPAERLLPGPLLHGPAAAEQLRIDGVDDGELLTAVAWHTLGDPRFAAMGRALYAADFLEPGRSYLPEWREEQRARMPHDLDTVTREVARARIRRGLERDGRIHPRTIDFWNGLVGDAP